MAEKTINERLQPSLLDRLTDDDPNSTVESRDQRVIDIRRLREIIQRDLAWLLNTTNNDGWIEPDKHPNAARSVLNYGVSPVTGDYSTEERAERIRKSIGRAVEYFEPRLRKGSTQVEFRSDDASRETTIYFDIRSDMWAEPIPMELYLRSTVDVTTGEVSLERKG
jgi:type VI secretion system protein ImpF